MFVHNSRDMFSQLHILYCQIFKIRMSGIVSFINYNDAEKPTFLMNVRILFSSHILQNYPLDF